MTAKTKSTTGQSGTTENPSETTRSCADGCGQPVGSKSRFRQGHDQRLVSQLASALTETGLTQHQRTLLDIDDGWDPTAPTEQRIEQVSDQAAKHLSSALAAKIRRAATLRAEKLAKQADSSETGTEANNSESSKQTKSAGTSSRAGSKAGAGQRAKSGDAGQRKQATKPGAANKETK